ncbi:hypothetical protein [Pollutibacter soli]|uniref:hypothetical protein n=1 Tax=Pollutibacter soli TaxID=3034157 RepID=UPI003013D08F
MKRIFAILLLSIQLISLGGYRIFFNYLEKQASLQIVERLDSGGFSDNQLIEIKIPYPVPYAANWGEYERYDGELELNGEHYNYVKRKMLNDTLYLLCIPNTAKNELNIAKKEIIANLSDVQLATSSKQQIPSNFVVKPFTTEFNHQFDSFEFATAMNLSKSVYSEFKSATIEIFSPVPFQPPRA